MNAPLADVEQFLARTPPFDLLDERLLARAARSFQGIYRRRDTVVLPLGEVCQTLYLIRRGAVEAHDCHGQLIARYGEGDHFGLQALLSGNPARFGVTLIEDGLIWCMEKADFDALRSRCAAFNDYYFRSLEERLVAAMRQIEGSHSGATMFMTPLAELARRAPILVTPCTSIADAAAIMREQGVSSLLIGEEESLAGIATDRDLRNRVLAEGRDPASAVGSIMTPSPLTLEADSPVLSGIVAMTARGIHHLPLLRGDKVVGMVTTRDLIGLQTHHPIYLAARIQKLATVEDVAAECQRIARLFELLLASGMRAEEVPRVMSTLADAVTRRLIALAEGVLGPAPAAWAWLAFGSQARQEQSLKTDQDNGLVYADDAPPDADAYFSRLARFVCDGLNACGFPWCPGGIMATTPDWRQPLAGWLRHFATWAGEPDPQAVLKVSIFFDLRGIEGDRELVARIQQAMADCSRGSGKAVFLTALAREAVQYEMPLGFFRRFVLESRGTHRETLEIKASGLLPLTDLVRVRALQAGITVPGTRDRLAALVAAGVMVCADADRLAGAHRLLSGLRVRLHADLVGQGQAPHNHLDVRRLSHAERSALRDAFVVVRQAQRALALDFPP